MSPSIKRIAKIALRATAVSVAAVAIGGWAAQGAVTVFWFIVSGEIITDADSGRLMRLVGGWVGAVTAALVAPDAHTAIGRWVRS